MKVEFTILGEPEGKQRPRINTQTRRAYTPEKTEIYEDMVRFEYYTQCGHAYFGDKEIRVNVTSYFGIAKSRSKKDKKLMQDGEIRGGKKPDVDNIYKIVTDALNGIAYKDDSKIVENENNKWFDDNPRVEVLITDEIKKRKSNGISTGAN